MLTSSSYHSLLVMGMLPDAASASTYDASMSDAAER